MTVARAAIRSPFESNEVGQHCGKCGTAKAEFDIFCNECHAPLVRRFGLLVPLEILLFLGTAVLMAMAGQHWLPDGYSHAPLAFIAQGMCLYLLRLSLRQPRFLLLAALYFIFTGALYSGMAIESTLLRVAPLYIGVGTLFLWSQRRQTQTAHGSLQTLWVACLVFVIGFGQFLKLSHEDLANYDSYLLPVQNFLVQYTPGLSIAALAITFGIQSARRVSHRGIVVGHYLLGARMILGPRGQTPILMLPVVVTGRALTTFYNAFVGVLGTLIRCFAFILKIAQAYTVALGQEALIMVVEVGRFLILCVARVGLPLFLLAYIARLSITLDAQISNYVFIATTWKDAMLIAMNAGLMAAALFASVVCLAEVSPPVFLETFLRDGAVLVAYGLPLLLVCTVALHFGGIATRKYFELDLPYQLGPFGWMTIGLLVFAMLLMGVRRLFVSGAPASR